MLTAFHDPRGSRGRVVIAGCISDKKNWIKRRHKEMSSSVSSHGAACSPYSMPPSPASAVPPVHASIIGVSSEQACLLAATSILLFCPVAPTTRDCNTRRFHTTQRFHEVTIPTFSNVVEPCHELRRLDEPSNSLV